MLRDGATHVLFEPLDFIAKLAALVPRPRVNLTRYHCIFAPNNHHRAQVTPGRRGRARPVQATAESVADLNERRAAMTWAQRLKRAFHIDVETCGECGGAVRVIACIEDLAIIKKDPHAFETKRPFSNRRPAATEPGAAGSQHVWLTRNSLR